MTDTERFADLQVLRYEVPGFAALPLRRKLLVYYLSEAALWGRDILWDQNGRFGLRLRQLLETIYTHHDHNDSSDDWKAFVVYLKRLWFSNGIHHHYSYLKLQPGFSRDFFLRELAAVGRTDDAEELVELIFNPDVMPRRVNQTDGQDLLLTSASNYYEDGITQAEAEAFYAKMKAQVDPERPPMLGLNSRLERGADGSLRENVWRSGGLYGATIDRITDMLSMARQYAENDRQQKVIDKLIEFYRTGDLKTFDEYAILWVGETESEVDFTNGFTEVYGDPLGLKASWEGYVNIIDHEATWRTQTLSSNAGWFEAHSPVDQRFKKTESKGVSAKVISAAILAGDLYPSSAIGINLPNSNWIREQYGSKSVTIANLTHALGQAAKGSGLREEFVVDNETRQLLDQYSDIQDELHTDLHECLGHGSGKLLPGVDADALRSYGSTIEEARADLFGLYYIADPKLVELGLTPNAEAYKAQYYSYLMNGLLTQLSRIEEGGQIEEAHMRNRALISRWVLDNYPEALQIVMRDGGHYLKVHDYAALRTAFGKLLAEVQRIKSEGDFQAARSLVEQYGVRIDPHLHHEVRVRYQRLNIAPYKGFINPKYELVKDAEGNIVDVAVSYDEAYDQQMLRYSREYKNQTPSNSPVKGEKLKGPLPSREGWGGSAGVLGLVLQELRAGMNGILSARMREAGMPFRLIFGVELPRLQGIADEFPREFELARQLWSRDIRETRLLAIMLMPVEAFTVDVAEAWGTELKTAEEAQVMAMMLLSKASHAVPTSLEWLQQGHSLQAVCACLCLLRLVRRGHTFAADEMQIISEQLPKMQPQADLHLRKAIQALSEAMKLHE